MRLTEHFTLEEAIFSSTATRQGINNYPSSSLIMHIRQTADDMELVRQLLYECPIHIDSWYRCSELNSLVGGTSNSDHMNGTAVDFRCPAFGNNIDICKRIEASDLKFDQLILEFGWVHLSFNPLLRREVLTAVKQDGKISYHKGL